MTYGKQMAIEGFFSAADMPEEKIGGWYVQGHDSADNYCDFVVVGRDGGWEIIARVAGWHDWFKAPVEIGNPLLEGEGSTDDSTISR